MATAVRKRTHPAHWAGRIGEAEWRVYAAVMDAASAARVPFALGGAFGLSSYTGGWRNTKDLDLYVLPQYQERMISLVSSLGLTDYYDRLAYDRQWIYRAWSDGVIVDLIWAMANHRAQVDEWWLSGPEVEIRGRTVKVVPAEAILWDKLYIMQRERCDWPDVMNLIYMQNADLDWEEVLRRLGGDTPLLAGALSVFSWLSPGVAARLPAWLWRKLNLAEPAGHGLPEVDGARASRLDTRPWYAQQPL